MRLVNKNPSDIPDIFKRAEVMEDLERITQGDLGLINPNIYKDTYRDQNGKTQSRVREKLNDYYFYKCAYCETYCKAEIEHYRPKLGVTGEPTHKGYYWLCYEWSNLVPSCRYCNTEGGKGNQFPIMSKRVTAPSLKNGKLDTDKCHPGKSPLIEEQPFLLHPELDNPKVYFKFKIDDEKKGIEIYGYDLNDRGNETVKICFLNRPYLKIDRLESVYYYTKKLIDNIFELLSDDVLTKDKLGKGLKIVFKQLEKDLLDEKLTHTLLRWFIINNIYNFENFFAPYIEDAKQRDIVIEAFKLYKSGQL